MPKKNGKRPSQMRTIYDLQAEICSALASPVRLHILDLLANGEKTASELLEILEIPKANLSQHLSVLKDAGIIQGRKEGLFNYMSLALPKVKDACALVRSVLLERMAAEERNNAEMMKELRAQRK